MKKPYIYTYTYTYADKDKLAFPMDEPVFAAVNAPSAIWHKTELGKVGFNDIFIVPSEFIPKPRTDGMRFRFLQDLEIAVEYFEDDDGNVEYVELHSKLGNRLCGAKEGFKTLAEAVDYLIDMEEI